MASEVSPVGSPIARKRSTAPAGGRGVFSSRMRSGAMRPVRRFSMGSPAPWLVVRSGVRGTAASRRRHGARGARPPRLALVSSRASSVQSSRILVSVDHDLHSSPYPFYYSNSPAKEKDQGRPRRGRDGRWLNANRRDFHVSHKGAHSIAVPGQKNFCPSPLQQLSTAPEAP